MAGIVSGISTVAFYLTRKNNLYLTINVNGYFSPINTLSTNYRDNKKGTNQDEPDLSLSVARSGVEPETFGL